LTIYRAADKKRTVTMPRLLAVASALICDIEFLPACNTRRRQNQLIISAQGLYLFH
jgi:hypothetical protein